LIFCLWSIKIQQQILKDTKAPRKQKKKEEKPANEAIKVEISEILPKVSAFLLW
jgi:hypothetical protein